jgi:proline iminopeptidase
MPAAPGRLVDIGDTALYIAERGQGHPLIVLHGGPGLDHHMFGDYLDPLGDACRLILVDQRANGLSGRPPEATWTLQQNAADVSGLARALGLAPCWATATAPSWRCSMRWTFRVPRP